MFTFAEEAQEVAFARIKVIGVGGGGCNAVNGMIEAGLAGIDFICANTDMQALKKARSHYKVQLGTRLTRGLGAGAKPKIGRESALEASEQIGELLNDTDMVFVTAGMGGGTGTGAAPVIANLAKEKNILTVGVVTKPFSFEGQRRARQAEEGLQELQQACHTVIVIPNDRLLNVVDRGTSITEAFLVVDDVLRQAIQGISDLVTQPGLVNVDFADVKTVMSHTGRALMGTGVARGERRAIEAVQKAISSPLLESSSIEGARGVLINFTGGKDLSVHEVSEASEMIEKQVDAEATIIWGMTLTETATEEIKVTVIATGFPEPEIARTPVVQLPSKEKLPLIQEDTKKLRGVDRFSRVEKDEWDIPTFLRRQAD